MNRVGVYRCSILRVMPVVFDYSSERIENDDPILFRQYPQPIILISNKVVKRIG
jgi:hypothetical protein